MTAQHLFTRGVIPGIVLLFLHCPTHGAEKKKKAVYREEISERSPDKAFAMRITREGEDDLSQSIQAIELVAMPSKKVVATLLPPDDLGTNFSGMSLLWSPDSKRCAFHYAHPRVGYTLAFERQGKGFREIELPSVSMQDDWIEGRPRKFNVRNEYISPVRWLKSGALVLENMSITRVWQHGQEEAEPDGFNYEITLTPSRNGKCEIREIRGDGAIYGTVGTRDRDEPNRMRGPGVRPGNPDAFEIGYEISCLSPDGKLGILQPDKGVCRKAGESARNFIVSIQLFRPLGLLDSTRGVSTGLRANWHPKGTAALITIESMTSPRAVYLLEFQEQRLVRKTELMQVLRKQFMPDFRASKAAPWGPGQPFAILDDRTWTWRWKDDRLEVSCQATSNPGGGGLHGTRVWWGKLEASWDIPSAQFAEAKVTRTFNGVVPKDDAMNKEDEETEEEIKPAEKIAKKEADKKSVWTLARSPDAKIQITWDTKSQVLSFAEEGKKPVQLEPKKKPEEKAADEKGDEKKEAADEKTEEDREEHSAAPPLPFFSPDGKWLFVNSPLTNELLLYADGATGWNLDENDPPEDLQRQAGQFLCSELNIENGDKELPVHASFVNWSSDSHRLLLAFDAAVALPDDHPKREDGSIEVHGWLCYFNLRTGKFELTDRLKAHNRGAVDGGNGRADDWELQAPLHAEATENPEVPLPAKARYDATDRKLGIVYEKLMAKATDDRRIALRDEQRAWLARRDLEASIYAVQSWSPFPEAARLEGLAISTEARVAELQRAIE